MPQEMWVSTCENSEDYNKPANLQGLIRALCPATVSSSGMYTVKSMNKGQSVIMYNFS